MSDNFIARSSIHDYKVCFEDDFAIVLDKQFDQIDIILHDENIEYFNTGKE